MGGGGRVSGAGAASAVGAVAAPPASEEQPAQHQKDHQYQDYYQQYLHPQLAKELFQPVQPVEPGITLHRDAGHQGQGAVGLAVEGDRDSAQLLALLYRGLHAFGVEGVVVFQILRGDVIGQQGGDLPLRGQGDVVGVLAQGDLHLRDVPLGAVQPDLPGEVVEPPLQQAAGFAEVGIPGAAGGPFLPLTAHDHRDQVPVLLGGGGRQAVARLRGKAGLDAGGVAVQVARDAEVGDQGVGGADDALLRVQVGGGHGVIEGGDDGAEGLVLHGLLAHQVHVVGGGVVVVVVVAVGVGKVGARHPQLGRPLVHQLHKAGHIPAHRLRHYVAGLIGRGQQGGVQQVDDPDLLPRLDVGGGGVVPDAGVDGLAGGDGLLQGQLPGVHRLQGEQAGHHLGDGGGVHLLMGVELVENFVGVRVHQDGGLGVHHHAVQDGAAAALPGGQGKG